MQMITKVLRKFKTSGIRGVWDATYRNLFSPAIHPIDVALDVISKKVGFSVIQLGAFIGNTDNDPLFKTIKKRLREVNGTLIVVEPVRSFYDELVKNYDGIPGVEFENVAISDRPGQATFYRLGVNPVVHGYPDWLSQLGSLNEKRTTDLWVSQDEVNKKLKEFYLKHRIQETVQCITFSELIVRHHLKTLDLLQIDVEGHEFEILRTIDFQEFPVRFVNYESNVFLHNEKKHAEHLMTKWGYHLIDYDQDTFCYKPSDEHLIKRMSRWYRPPISSGRFSQ